MGLQIELAKKFKKFALDASFSVESELSVLFGPSGSGKSLTLKMLAGLITPDEGKIILDGEILYDSAAGISLPAHRRSIGYVFQDLALFPHMSVQQNIAYALPKEKDKLVVARKVDEMLHRLEIDNVADSSVDEISGGQRQRVAIARAIIAHPALLLLDEPFSSLDMKLKKEIYQLLLKLKEHLQIPIILVTHDLWEAKKLASKIVVYGGGRIERTIARSEIEELSF